MNESNKIDIEVIKKLVCCDEEDFKDPCTSTWVSDLLEQSTIIEITIAKLKDEQKEVMDFYGTLSMAYNNYTKVINSLENKRKEITRRINYILSKNYNKE